MTIEEKLKHFEEVCIGDAKTKYDQAVSDYTAYEERLFGEHRDQAKKQAALRLQDEKERMRRELNKRLSVSQISIKREYSKKSDELQGKIFSELRDRLARFMETQSYEDLLLKQIKAAAEFAGESELHVYIDPSDQEKQNMLSMQTGCTILVSQYSFIGGTRAVIASKNVLIDNSFETKLKEAGETFQFHIGTAV